MKLKNWVGLLPFCAGIFMSPYAMSNVRTNYSAQTEVSVSDVEVKKKELKEYLKTDSDIHCLLRKRIKGK